MCPSADLEDMCQSKAGLQGGHRLCDVFSVLNYPALVYASIAADLESGCKKTAVRNLLLAS